MRKKRMLISILLSIVVLILLAGAALWVTRDSVAQAWSLLTLPQELRMAQIDTHSGKHYRISGWSLVPIDHTVSANLKPILAQKASTEKIYQLTISGDGTEAAFVNLTGTTSSSTVSGHVHVVGDGIDQDAGIGFSPFFVDDSYIGMLTTQGIFVTPIAQRALTSADTKLVLAHPFTSASGVRISVPKEGHVIAFAEGPSRIAVYRIFPDTTRFATAYTGSFLSYSLSSTALYVVHAAAHSTEIIRVPFTGPQKVIHSFPEAMKVTALTL